MQNKIACQSRYSAAQIYPNQNIRVTRVSPIHVYVRICICTAHIWGGSVICAGVPGIYSSASDCQSFHIFFAAGEILLSFNLSAHPSPFGFMVKYVVLVSTGFSV